MHALRAATLAGVALALVLAPSLARPDDDDCLACHGVGEDLVDLEAHLQVDVDAWLASVHSSDLDFACVDCHEGIGDYPHEEDVEPATCANCHEDAVDEFAESTHANGREENSPFPRNDPCIACHGLHDVLAVDDPLSPVYFRNIPDTCGRCHSDIGLAETRGLKSAPADRYSQSVHGLHLDDPDSQPAVCTDCHGYHKGTLARDPISPTNPFNIPTTCGRCHEQESEDYLESVHGVAFRRGVSMAPNCTDCHGIHNIAEIHAEGDEDDVPSHQARLLRTTCPACHGSEALMSEYGMAPARVSTYRASYHGLAQQRGATAVADCASCHGIHAIFPSSDTRSTVATENLHETCGHCHPGASEEFASSPVHFVEGEGEGAETSIVAWVKRIYWALLIGVLGGMVLHNAVILGYYVRRKARQQRHLPQRRRFSRSQTAQHALLFVTFALLAVSGFMLAYPETWWSRLLGQAGIDEDARRLIHRVAAVGMIGASIYHAYWILFTSYGRQELARIRPRVRDVRELVTNLRFHMGASTRPAHFAKYDYPAKAEYWALVWGTAVMALTGLVLWFPVWATSFMPGWVVKVAEVIHLFEAWLATLAILLFHFFYVFGHPDVYPINTAMFSGRVTEDHAHHHHPDWREDDPPKAPDSPDDADASDAHVDEEPAALGP